jgi:antitoxin component YwqK of YwqJK toxin-antitoxin module
MKTSPRRQLPLFTAIAIAAVLAGTLNGEVEKTLHPNGQVHEVIPREDGWIQGVYQEFDDSGRLIREIPHKDNRWHGTAKFYYSNGNLREQTEYALGVKHGTKLTFYESGAKREQIPYKKDWAQGSYLEFNESGKLIRDIPHKDNEWHGVAKFYYPNGQLSEEQSRVNGRLDGMKRTYHASGSVREEIPYKEGWVQGTYREFDEFGELIREVPHKDNEWHGHVRFFHPNGQLSEEQMRVNGKLDGLKRSYFVSGACREEVPYKEGWAQGMYREWSEPGALVREIPHKDNEWHGIARWFHSNGQLAEETPFWMGTRHGLSRKFDRDGKLVSTTTHVAPDAPADADAQIAAATPPSRVGAPAPTADAADAAGVASPAPTPPPVAAGTDPVIARSTDPETGITTTSNSRPDGSRVVTKTDKDGNVIESSVYPPDGTEPAFASSVDPETGVMTTSVTAADGTRTVTKTETIKGDGFDKIVETDDRGNRTETIVPADGGAPTITETDADGNTRTITPAADGGFTVVESTPEGYTTETKRDAVGNTVTVRRDLDGSSMETITRTPDGREVREDARGNKVETSTSTEGLVTETKTDRRGNSTTVVSDAQGTEVSRTEDRVTPVDPGQEYFEDVLGGTDWENVPQSLRTRYANSEQEIRNNAAAQALRDEQEVDRKRVDAEMRADSEARMRATDEKLAAIQAEEEAAQAAIAKREAREERARAIEESHEIADKLQGDYDAAVARGGKREAARIMAEQDRHHDASMELLEFTPEEQAEADRKQSVRDRLVEEIVASARGEAATKVDQDWEQDLKDTVTSGTQYVSVGSQMQQETKESTRRANYELAFAEAKKSRIEKRLEDPNLSKEEREILGDMLDLAAVQEAGAAAQLSSNANLTTAGYAIDVGMLASGGLANAGVALGAKATARVAGEKAAEKFVSVVAERGITDLGKSGVMAATERLAGKETAEALAARAVAAREAVTAAGERLSQAGSSVATRVVGQEGVERIASAATKISDTLSTDLATGAAGESTLIRAAAEDMVAGATIDTGMQLATTGTVDVGEVVRGAVAGGVVAGGTAVLPGGSAARAGAPGADAPPRVPANAPPPPRPSGGGLAAAVETPPPVVAPARPVPPPEPPRTEAATNTPTPARPATPSVNRDAPTVATQTPDASQSGSRTALQDTMPHEHNPANTPVVNSPPPSRPAASPVSRPAVEPPPSRPQPQPAPVDRSAPTVATQSPDALLAGSRTALHDTAPHVHDPRRTPVAEPALADTIVEPAVATGAPARQPDPMPPPRDTGRRAPSEVNPSETGDAFLRDASSRTSADVLHEDPNVGARAIERARQVEAADAAWQRLSPADRARAQEAWETFQRLRRSNPNVAAMDEVDAFTRLAEGASRTRDGLGTGNRFAPEEMVANVATSRGVPVGADELSRAANVSLPNAEGAIAGSAPYAPHGGLPIYNPALDVPTPGAAKPAAAASPPAADVMPPRNTAAFPDVIPPPDATRKFDEVLPAPAPVSDAAMEALRRRTDEFFGNPVEPPPGPATPGTRPPPVDAPAGPSAARGDAVPALPVLDQASMPGRTATINSGGASTEIKFGTFINEGAFNQVYNIDGQPGKVVRVSKGPSERLEARVDLQGRRALESSREGLAGSLEFVEAETFTNVQSSDPDLNGRTISIMRKVDTRASEQLKTNPGGQPTAGQAIAYDRGVRALNNQGYAMLDGHTANYYFRPAGGDDEWVMVVIDPGGIVPARGLDPAAARKIQTMVDDPPNRAPAPGGPAPGQDRGPISYVSKALDMQPVLDEFADPQRMGLASMKEIVETGPHDLPLFKPAGAEDFPDVRRLFSVSDAEAEAAYAALRAAAGSTP